ncbi:DUF4436 family protein [Kitasatospora viridis]|uniref:Uncharacterized protein DUF4436 n=1 Tax=Kitasatospora viridis TaxID=281105 RepID=A0A561TUW2_9ACTN|nr:DUF4436 family protein [Kitasatospora viridis]TWF90900.1 uncharacterized protein DUF4436 [Kitasatospora viridis]
MVRRGVRRERVRVRARVRLRVRAASPPAEPHPRVRIWRPAAVLGLLAVLCVSGLLLYFDERSSRDRQQVVGTVATGDYLVVAVTLQHVDPVGATVSAKVLIEPQGTLQSADNPLAPTRDLVLDTSSLDQAVLRFPAGQQIGSSTVNFPLTDGRVSDYPFDSYQSLVGFQATAGGASVPVVVGVVEADPFFAMHQGGHQSEQGTVAVTERMARSRSTFIFAWFMIVAMWSLGLSVLFVAWLITKQRRGLIWPALGWMAATLFALIGMRNAAPGSPPIGSLLDYAAFYWAEALVALGLTVTVLRGLRVESGERRG